MEEEVYAKLWQLDAQKKLDRELSEAQEKKGRVADTMAALDWQKQTRELQRDAEKGQTSAEQMMLTDQWTTEAEKEKQAEKDLHLLNRERNLELIKHNEAEKTLRE